MNEPIVTTASGAIRGSVCEGIYTFKGIPYGASTEGEGRFSPPRAPMPWSGVRDATDYGPRCPQRSDPVGDALLGGGEPEPMSEDCLRLNVWTPGLLDGAARPIMVWFHGGGFSSLSGSSRMYDGVRLCQRGDVVVVTLNHRLNLFGFTYLRALGGERYADSGNAGMLDLVLALQWVQQHADTFGGDARNVTVFGESGGGAKVSVLMGMPEARGLFHRAIVQSGAHLHAQHPDAATDHAERLLHALELPSRDLEELHRLPTQRLIDAYAKAAPRAGSRVHFSPVADGRSLPREPWKPDAPACSAHVPLLLCSTRTETTLLLGGRNPSLFELDDAGLRERLLAWLPQNDVSVVVEAFQKIHPDVSPSELFFLITSDLYARCPAWAQADRKSAQGGAPVWMCELVWDTPVQGGKWRSPHTLDIPFVFDNVGRAPSFARPSPETQSIAEAMSSAWLAFAHRGDPNHARNPAWPPYTAQHPATLLFDVTPRLERDWRSGERQALRDVPLREERR